MTRVGAELPRPQTQSGLKAHSLSPAIGPASVARRCAPRGSSSRRQRGGPTGREPSYAGAAQYPCAGHRGGRPRAAPSSTPDEARARGPGAPVVPDWADNCCLGGWATPHQGAVGRSRPHPGPARASSSPHVLTRDGGKTVTSLPARVQAEIPRASPRGPRGPRASRARNSTPPGPGPSGTGVREGQGRASPVTSWAP
jgi:hypothetical protein